MPTCPAPPGITIFMKWIKDRMAAPVIREIHGDSKRGTPQCGVDPGACDESQGDSCRTRTHLDTAPDCKRAGAGRLRRFIVREPTGQSFGLFPSEAEAA